MCFTYSCVLHVNCCCKRLRMACSEAAIDVNLETCEEVYLKWWVYMTFLVNLFGTNMQISVYCMYLLHLLLIKFCSLFPFHKKARQVKVYRSVKQHLIRHSSRYHFLSVRMFKLKVTCISQTRLNAWCCQCMENIALNCKMTDEQ
jgi:hypothetical protein